MSASASVGGELARPKREISSLELVSKRRLLRDFSTLMASERAHTARLLAYIGEIDRRRLYLEYAHPSMFAFCTKRFGMSEAVAAKRIRAGRAACRFPSILEMVRRGELHLSGVHQLAVHLTVANHRQVLRRAKHRSMREIELLIAEIAPQPDARSLVRALPQQRGEVSKESSRWRDAGSVGAVGAVGDVTSEEATNGLWNGESGAESSPVNPSEPRAHGLGSARTPKSTTTPLSPGRFRLQVTIGQEARDTLAELQSLLSHQIPNGDPALVVERALSTLLVETKKKKAALTSRPRRKPRAEAGKAHAGDKRRLGSGAARGTNAKSGPKDAQDEHEEMGAAREPKRNGKPGKRSRAIPASVRREVFQRDSGRCTFVDPEGQRCESSWQLEFHHRVPYSRGGAHDPGNVELRCRAHNQYEAELEYGSSFMEAKRGQGSEP